MSNHTEEKCWRKPKKNDQGNSQRSNKVCYKCGMIGHYANVCHSKKREGAHVSLEEEDLEDEHMLFSASEESSTTLGENVWLVDSGCTNQDAKGKKIAEIEMTNRSFKIKSSSVKKEAWSEEEI